MCRGHRDGPGLRGRASGVGFPESPSRLCDSRSAAMGTPCVFINGQRAAGRRPPNRLLQTERRTMLRRNFVGIVVLALLSTVALAAQVKEMPRTPIKPINK